MKEMSVTRIVLTVLMIELTIGFFCYQMRGLVTAVKTAAARYERAR